MDHCSNETLVISDYGEFIRQSVDSLCRDGADARIA